MSTATTHDVSIDFDRNETADRRWIALCHDGCDVLGETGSRQQALALMVDHTGRSTELHLEDLRDRVAYLEMFVFAMRSAAGMVIPPIND